MTRGGFLWAKLTGNDGWIARHTTPTASLMSALAGQRIALIGNARSLSQLRFGPEIDAADIVIPSTQRPSPPKPATAAARISSRCPPRSRRKPLPPATPHACCG